MTIGKRIQRIIKEKGLRYSAVAQALDISVQYLKKVREDKAENVSIALYKAFCYEYQIHYDYLIHGKMPIPVNVDCHASDACKQACIICESLPPDQQQMIFEMLEGINKPRDGTSEGSVSKSLRERKRR
jgi:transcriptional regulator with XRE-family HTH domain